MIVGAALVLAALSLFLWNQREDKRAGASVEAILPRVIGEIRTAEAEKESEDTVYPDPYDTEMTEVEIDGYYYIGYLSIPALGLELPVMSGWSYPQLKLSPCRYSGSTKTDNLVVAAHNYTRHFGPIKNLSEGDEVIFTDMDGGVYRYAVAEVEILEPADIEEMTGSGYPLTLFTCTYGGKTRVTVRCEQK